MKNKANQIALLYTLSTLFLAIISFKLAKLYSFSNYYAFNFIKDLFFITATGLFFRYILYKNDKRSSEINKNLRHTNDKLKESNDKYDIVAKATSDTIWDWKIPEDQITWNKGIKEIFGYSQNQVGHNSKWWFDNIHPEDSIKMSVKLYSFLEQKTEKWQDQYRFKCSDGSYKYVLDRGFIIKDENDKAIRMIGTIQDITKQKEEENRLKLLETVFTEAKDAIIITEAVSDDNQIPKIVFANPAFNTMSGYDHSEVIGKSLNSFMGKNSDLLEIEKLTDSIKNKKECFLEIILYKKDQSEYWVRLSFLPVYNVEHDLSHWISIQRDVTEEKTLEKEKEILIRELTQNNKDLKQFSYITSHNLRAPLSNLTGLLNLTEFLTIEDEELKEILNGFKISTHLLNETINDLAKVITIKDSASIQNEELLIQDVFKNILSQLHIQLEEIKPQLNISYGNITKIHTNKAYFESIFINLLTNSLKYRSHDRNLIIDITITEEENDTLKIIFRDNGIGIDLERNKNKIFGLYQRFHDYPDSKGLGLFLVKSQIETMGGNISIKSKVDKGTEFILTFKS
ncbi:PAS domain-containing sensor histidine kinase [Flavobacterium gilvum]|uniref:histidine kinase n=1 Tax=Flavobacterium gilvum TaxID=1492737 RepID=A0AAC9I4Z6_9FLAO|nr:PAS domain-containing sensor histidine kinase [Flavobacterium gilvum]AOW10959.1 PAS domain-containing sensor histidine kinase [Flavobacterium gilvum]KFC60735.1 histidine kinase [Flavobacterium gilvum]